MVRNTQEANNCDKTNANNDVKLPMLLISTRCKLDRIEYRSNIFYLQRLNRTGNKSRKIFRWKIKWKMEANVKIRLKRPNV